MLSVSYTCRGHCTKLSIYYAFFFAKCEAKSLMFVKKCLCEISEVSSEIVRQEQSNLILAKNRYNLSPIPNKFSALIFGNDGY